MAIRNILQEEDSNDNIILRKQSKKVTVFDENLWQLIDDMWDTMYQNDGAGLSAVQVGVLKSVIVADVNEIKLELINAQIISQQGSICREEGCLSVRGKKGYVIRPQKVTVKAQDRYGDYYTITCEKMLARCLCHEIDHTKGVLYIDKLAPNPVKSESQE